MKAAYTLFCERGYEGTTMADVAKQAGVAVQTVYFVFHTKRDLLSGSYELAVLGEADPLLPERQAWYLAAQRAPDLSSAIKQLVAGAGEIVRRATPLDTVVRAAALDDEDSAAVWAHSEKLRFEGYRGMVELLATKARLRPGLNVERATHLLLMYLGPGVYRALVIDYGWTDEDWLEFVVRAIEDELFRPATPV
jgi:AcrR family transcriptional regulator